MLLKKQKECIIIDRSLILTAMWNIIKSAAGRNVKNEYMHQLNIDGNITNNYQVISDSFSSYLSSVAEKIAVSKNDNHISN